jgi:deoxyribonuclease-4
MRALFFSNATGVLNNNTQTIPARTCHVIMPYLGAHESISGGLHRAFDRIEQVGGQALQIFTRNQRQWKTAPVDTAEADQFYHRWQEMDQMPVAAHSSYLINLGSGKEQMIAKSIAALADELVRCERLGVGQVVLHPGSHGGDGVEKGCKRVARHLDLVFAEVGPENSVQVLLETTAGQGTSLGSRFEELAQMYSLCKHKERIGFCFDTCHVFAAGYDIRNEQGYMEVMRRWDELIGCELIRFFHLNDSKKELGSRVDRHEHIGRGCIGLEGFQCLLNDARFADHPMTLETPKGEDLADDRKNLARLRRLLIARSR